MPIQAMLRSRRGIRVLAAVTVLLMLAALPTLAARRRVVESFEMTGPARTFHSGDVTVTWRWKGGSAMRARYVGLSTLVPGNNADVKLIALSVPIWHGRAVWDSTQWEDGEYIVRGIVVGTRHRGYAYKVNIDNTAPEVAITQPAEGDAQINPANLFLEAANLDLPATVVVGKARLHADATDAGAGVKTIRWYVDGELIAEGNDAEADFSAYPGEHTLRAEAEDWAGNVASTERTIFAVGNDTSSAPPSAPGVPEPPLGSDDDGEPGGGLPELPPATVPAAPALPSEPDEALLPDMGFLTLD